MARSNNHNKTWETRDSRTPEQKLWMAVLGAAAEDAVSMAELDCTGRWRNDSIVHMDKEYFLNPKIKEIAVAQFSGGVLGEPACPNASWVLYNPFGSQGIP